MFVAKRVFDKLFPHKGESGSTSHTHFLWLRFHDATLEYGFVLHNSSRLNRTISRALCCLLILLLWYAISIPGLPRDDGRITTLLTVMIGSLMFCAVVALISFNLPLAAKNITPRAYEMAGMVLVVIVSGTLFSWQAYVKFVMRAGLINEMMSYAYGTANEPAAQARADNTAIMWIFVVVMGMHFCVPFRYCFLIWIDAGLCWVYPAIVLASGTMTRSQYLLENSFTICLIIGFAGIGKYNAEVTERSLFSKYLQEKIQRVQTEHMLSEQTKPNPKLDARSDAAFDLSTVKDHSMRFQGIIDLGRKEHWLIEARSLEMSSTSVIGEGGFGKVVTATLHGTPVVVKMPRSPLQSWVGAEDRRLKALGSELRVMRKLRHPNIVAFHGAVVCRGEERLPKPPTLIEGDEEAPSSSSADIGQPPDFGIVLERVFGEELNKYVESSASPNSFNAIIIDISRALQHMHSQDPQVLHADLKPNNILVERLSRGTSVRPRAKLIDFGLAKVLDPAGAWGQRGGAKAWTAPEQRMGVASSTTAIDMFALGCVIHYMETGRPQPVSHPAGATWDTPKRPFLSDMSRQIAVRCLSVNPGERPDSLAELPVLRKLVEDNSPDEFSERAFWLSSGPSNTCTPSTKRPHSNGVRPHSSEYSCDSFENKLMQNFENHVVNWCEKYPGQHPPMDKVCDTDI